MARKGLPEQGNEGAATGAEPKKGRGPNKPKGLEIALPPELHSEIAATAQRFGKGNPKRTALAHQDITALIAGAHQEFAKSHVGQVGAMYLAELNRLAENPLADAFK
jgi:hypothetical protein